MRRATFSWYEAVLCQYVTAFLPGRGTYQDADTPFLRGLAGRAEKRSVALRLAVDMLGSATNVDQLFAACRLRLSGS